MQLLLHQIIINEFKSNGVVAANDNLSSSLSISSPIVMERTSPSSPSSPTATTQSPVFDVLPSDCQWNMNPQYKHDRTMMFVTGKNDYLQLVAGEKVIYDFTCHLDQQLPFSLDDVIHIANGDNHSIFLTSDGKAFGIGSNTQGQLGEFNVEFGVLFEIKIKQSKRGRITKVACGSFHSIILNSDGSIWVTGDNSFHQLGIEVDHLKCFTKVEFPQDTPISHISTSYSHTLCYSERDNILYSMGTTFGDDTEYFTPHRLTFFDDKDFKLTSVNAGYRYSAFLTSNHTVYIMGKIEKYNVFEPTQLNLFEPLVQVFSGGKHLFLKTISNQFYGLGMNDDKQLPFSKVITGTIEPQLLQLPSHEQVSDMAAGSYHTALTTSSGNIYVCGWSELGQTGLGKNTITADCTPLSLDPSVVLDISRGTTSVKLFLSSSADNSFILLKRAHNIGRFYCRLFHSVLSCNSLCDVKIISHHADHTATTEAKK